MASNRFFFIVFLLIGGLTACGQTGALYLPEDAATNPAPTPTNPAP